MTKEKIELEDELLEDVNGGYSNNDSTYNLDLGDCFKYLDGTILKVSQNYRNIKAGQLLFVEIIYLRIDGSVSGITESEEYFNPNLINNNTFVGNNTY